VAPPARSGAGGERRAEPLQRYTRLLGTPPAKRRPGYANLAVADPPLKLVLIEHPGRGATLNHLGVEVESTGVVHAETERLAAAGLLTLVENDTTCCYARQDKVWVTGPGGERWEVYTVNADSDAFGVGPAAAARRHLAALATCCQPSWWAARWRAARAAVRIRSAAPCGT
jgi:hypothetical protein